MSDRLSLIASDMRRSAIAGPIQVLVNTLGYLVVYPLIIDKNGLEVLGLWGVLTAVTLYLGLSDVGFSVQLTRSLSRDSGTIQQRVSEYRFDYDAAVFVYRIVTSFAVLAWLGGAYLFQSELPNVYSHFGLTLSVAILLVGAAANLEAQLGFAILSGIHQTYYAQLVATAFVSLRFVAGLVGALKAHPIEGLAIGYAIENIAKAIVARRIIGLRIPGWSSSAQYSLAALLSRARSMARSGRSLYLISLGMVLREPIFRLVLSYSLGLAAVGIYDIAKRVPELLRGLLTGGTQSYLASLGYMHAGGKTVELEATIKRISTTLCAGGVLLLGGVFIFAEPLYRFWLPSVGSEVVSATWLLAAWCFLTLLNVPYWYLLQASHNEQVAARSLWWHTGLVLGLIPLGYFWKYSLIGALVYWSATSILTQFAIYMHTQRIFGMLRRTLFVAPAYSLGVGAILMTSVAAGWLSIGRHADSLLGALGCGIVFGLGWLVLFGGCLRGLVGPRGSR